MGIDRKDDANLVVIFNGKPVFKLNRKLLDIKDCWDNLEKIKATHEIKLMVYEAIKNEKDPDVLKSHANHLTQLEFKLQELWGFSQNAKFHRFWDTPKCKCAKIDNEDAYPTGYYSISGNCPLHGA
jgi:hypothetical protein